MQLNPGAFNSFLNGIGQQFKWRKSFRCPCVNPHSGAAKPNCGQCGGKSWLWEEPIDAVAGMAGQKIQLTWANFGLWQNGDAVVTIGSDSPMYEMGQMDRVLMMNSTDGFSLVLKRGSPDEQLYEPIESLTRVFWLDAEEQIVAGVLPTVLDDGTLAWPENGAPPLGATYSLSGKRYSEYFCWGPYPSDRNEHSGAQLPKRVVLRRFDLFGRDLKANA